jgi:hypothetical protein
MSNIATIPMIAVNGTRATEYSAKDPTHQFRGKALGPVK